ncbi:MAG TPA: hypothetical protein VL475_11400 [Planctomycetaceae bacterium]|nr:hypothetical protein [Planctomycetaceae bacterium]
MPDTSARSTLGVRHTQTGRLQFHVRLPDVASDQSGVPSSLDNSFEQPRGMKVLHQILDERPRSGGRRFAGPRGLRALRYISALLIGLSCLAVAWDLTREPSATNGSGSPAPFDDEYGDLDSEPADQRPVAAKSGTGQGAPSGAIQTIVYQTSEPAPPPRTAWLEGSILPDEPDTPRDSQGP